MATAATAAGRTWLPKATEATFELSGKYGGWCVARRAAPAKLRIAIDALHADPLPFDQEMASVLNAAHLTCSLWRAWSTIETKPSGIQIPDESGLGGKLQGATSTSRVPQAMLLAEGMVDAHHRSRRAFSR